MRLTIRTRLFLLLCVLVLSLATLAGTGFLLSKDVRTAVALSNLRQEQSALTMEMRLRLNDLMLGAMNSIVDRAYGSIETSRAKAMQENADFLRARLADLTAAADTDEEKELAEDVTKKFGTVERLALKQLPMTIANKAGDEDFDRLADLLDMSSKRVEAQLKLFEESVRSENAEAGQMLEAEMRRSMLLNLGVAITAAVVLSVALLLVGRGITRPLARGVDFARAVAAGDLERDLDIKPGDEIGDLADALREMVSQLRKLLAEAAAQGEAAKQEAERARTATAEAESARGRAEQAKKDGMRQAADSLAGVVEGVGRAVRELAGQISQASSGAVEQSDRAQSTATAMEQMNASVLEVARSAGGAATTTEEAKARAEEGAGIVGEAVTAIDRVQVMARGLTERMTALGKKAEDIGRIMGVITDIADQTNLLALNAAIEAARAGDAGRGFAVVADEVRKLAEKTMTATKEVGDAIKGIQDETKGSVRGMEEAAVAVDRATELAAGSGRSLASIVGLVEGCTDQVRAIAAASEEQSATSEEISRTAEDVGRIAAETAEAMRHAEAAVDDLSVQAARLEELMRELENS